MHWGRKRGEMMRIRITAVCLVAAFAMAAVAGTSALAANPEFGRCLKTKAGGGTKYTTAKCTVVATGGEKENFEWYKAFGSAKPLAKTGFSATLKPTTIATLETKVGTKVTCKSLAAKAKFTSNTTISGSQTDFSECESGGIKCNTKGAGTGVIKVKELEGELGVIKKEVPSTKDKIGTVLWPAGGKPEIGETASVFVEFECGTLTVKVRGAVISPITSNAMKLSATVKFTAAKGVQKPTKFEGGAPMYLESKFSAASYEQSGQSATTVQTAEEKVEARSL
jgi:hypothetical protein